MKVKWTSETTTTVCPRSQNKGKFEKKKRKHKPHAGCAAAPKVENLVTRNCSAGSVLPASVDANLLKKAHKVGCVRVRGLLIAHKTVYSVREMGDVLEVIHHRRRRGLYLFELVLWTKLIGIVCAGENCTVIYGQSQSVPVIFRFLLLVWETNLRCWANEMQPCWECCALLTSLVEICDNFGVWECGDGLIGWTVAQLMTWKSIAAWMIWNFRVYRFLVIPN